MTLLDPPKSERPRWWRRLFCKHDWTWVRNIYGDEIIWAGYKRSVWRCVACGTEKLEDELWSNVDEYRP